MLANKIEGMLDILDGRITRAEIKKAEDVKRELEYLRRRYIELLSGKEAGIEAEKGDANSHLSVLGIGCRI